MRHLPKVIDIYAGVGGLTLGAARAGFEVVGAVDNDHTTSQAHKFNFPRTHHILADVRGLSGRQLLNRLGLRPKDVAGVIGGPPCQGFSEIGPRDGSDPRNGLLIDFFRLVADIRPLFFVAENVPGILAERNQPALEQALAQIPKSYTLIPPFTIEANKLGAPTKRRRVFLIGYDPGAVEKLDEPFLARGNDTDVRVREALQGLPPLRSEWQTESQSWRAVGSMDKSWFGVRVTDHVPRGIGNAEAVRQYRRKNVASGFLGTKHTTETVRRFALLGPGECDSVSKGIRLDRAGYCPTLRAGTGPDRGSFQAVRPIHPTSPRVISPREAARLQGFPDWFVFHPTKWHAFRQIGNSVSPIVAEVLLSRIRDCIGAQSTDSTNTGN